MLAVDGHLAELGSPGYVTGVTGDPSLSYTPKRVTRHDPLVFQVYNSLGGARIEDVCVISKQSGIQEVVYLHEQFQPEYLNSRVVVSGNRLIFTLRRRIGWVTKPEIRVYAWGFEA